MSRILCEFRFPTGEVKYGVWCDTADLLVTRRTFASKEDAEQFRQWVGLWRGATPNEEPPPVGSLGEASGRFGTLVLLDAEGREVSDEK